MILSSKETKAQKNELNVLEREAMSGAKQETHTPIVTLLRASHYSGLAFAALSALPLHHYFMSFPVLPASS